MMGVNGGMGVNGRMGVNGVMGNGGNVGNGKKFCWRWEVEKKGDRRHVGHVDPVFVGCLPKALMAGIEGQKERNISVSFQQYHFKK